MTEHDARDVIRQVSIQIFTNINKYLVYLCLFCLKLLQYLQSVNITNFSNCKNNLYFIQYSSIYNLL